MKQLLLFHCTNTLKPSYWLLFNSLFVIWVLRASLLLSEFFFFLEVEGKVAELLVVSFLPFPLLNTDPVHMLFPSLVPHQPPAVLLESNC